MKLLFITLEQSARENLKSILKNKFFLSNHKKIYTYGMNKDLVFFKDITGVKVKSIMGISNVIYNFKYLLKLRRNLFEIINKEDFTHVFFVDSFDFTKFYLNKYKSKKINYCQIIGPSVFIWRKNKANFINKEMNKLFSIFHIEKKYYKKNIYSYIGHPILHNIYKNEIIIKKVSNIGFFLGSRSQEIEKNILVVKDLIYLLSNYKEYNYHFFITNEFKKYVKNKLSDFKNIKFYLNDDRYYKNISKLDFAFACSGTVHLELSFSNIPHYIFYKASSFNYFIFKFFVKSKYLSLLNIFSKKLVVKEFVQKDFNSLNIFNHFKLLTSDINNLQNYQKYIKKSLKESNFSSLNSKPIIDYLKKFSLAIKG